MSRRDPSSRIRKQYRLIRTTVVGAALLLLLVACLLWQRDGKHLPSPRALRDGEVQFHFIDVGQGDAALIRTADGDILIDGGTNAAEERILAYLDMLGVTELAYAVFTHPDEDHIGGADGIILRYRPLRVMLPDLSHDSPDSSNLAAAIRSEGCEVITASPGQSFRVGGLTCAVLAPLPDSCGQGVCPGSNCPHLNDHSVILRVDFGETSALFVGDAESAAEEALLRQYGTAPGGMLDCDILKLGHHGAATSSKDAFLRAVSPAFGVISCGKGNSHGHPDQVVLARCDGLHISVFRTDLEGSIVFTSTGQEPSRE